MSCDDCCRGYTLPGTPRGEIIEGAYFAAAPNQDAARKIAIVYLMDAFGFELNNPQIMADHFANELNMDVWVPDIFNGQPLFKFEELQGLRPDRAGQKMTVVQTAKRAVKIITHLPRLYANRPSVADSRIRSFVEKIREKNGYEKVGAIGYCFGGAASVRLASTSLVNSIVVCHPGPLSEREINAIQVPVAWVCAEDDFTFGKAARKRAEDALAKRKDTPGSVEYEFKEYKGTVHGFASRPNLELDDIKASFEAAQGQACVWFRKTL